MTNDSGLNTAVAPRAGRWTVALALAAAMAVAVMSLIAAKPAAAAFSIMESGGSATNPDGTRNAQAGGHPDLRTKIKFPLTGAGVGVRPEGDMRDTEVAVPPGVVGNPTVVPRCTMEQLASFGFGSVPQCAANTQVGVANIDFVFGGEPFTGPFSIYNMEAPRGLPAQFGFSVLGVPVLLQPELRGEDFGLTVFSRDTSQTVPITGVDIKIWGVPADPVHDPERMDPNGMSGIPSNLPQKAFITAPMNCAAGPLTTSVRARSWQEPLIWSTASFNTDLEGRPMQAENCERVPFTPSFEARVETAKPNAPTGLNVGLKFPAEGLLDPNGVASGELKRAAVTLPEGMTINPASAVGLEACSDGQLGLGSTAPAQCPQAAKIGTIEASTPLLEEQLTGGIYLRSQGSLDPESGQMFRIALVLENEERGIRVKLPGSVHANRASGQLVTVFDNNPQLPVSSIELQFKGGARAPLLTPSSCGEKTIAAELSSWSGKAVQRQASFRVSCASGHGGFTPTFEAGTENPVAASYSSFLASITKPDADSELTGLRMQLPKGLLANLGGKLGSQVGSVTAFAGPGATPYAFPGAVYLEGPYRGAPYSLRVVVPAKAGPFDLGEVTVRQALQVDPLTTEVTAVSDPIPTIVAGVPVHLQRLDVRIDRPEFTVNPTSCDPMEVTATLGSALGQSANAQSPFQAVNCERLKFKPKLTLSVKGPTHRSAHPRLKAVLTMPGGGANIEKAQVTLPKTEFLENAHIRTICTRVQYAAGKGGGAQCPPASVYGKARAFSPLLDKPLEGPVFLRSSSNPLPDLVASLDGQIHVDLIGRIDSVNARIRNTFEGVPDAPVSKFVLEMQGGKKGLLVNNTELCKTTPRATVKFDGQNGKLAGSTPVMRADCGKKKRGNKKK